MAFAFDKSILSDKLQDLYYAINKSSSIENALVCLKELYKIISSDYIFIGKVSCLIQPYRLYLISI